MKKVGSSCEGHSISGEYFPLLERMSPALAPFGLRQFATLSTHPDVSSSETWPPDASASAKDSCEDGRQPFTSASLPPMETVTHHQGYCIVAVASEEPYSATYLITKHDWCGEDGPVQGVCPGAFASQGEALASAVRAATRYIDSQPS